RLGVAAARCQAKIGPDKLPCHPELARDLGPANVIPSLRGIYESPHPEAEPKDLGLRRRSFASLRMKRAIVPLARHSAPSSFLLGLPPRRCSDLYLGWARGAVSPKLAPRS